MEVRGDLVVAHGRTVSGVDVSTLSDRVVTLNTQQTLEGEVVSAAARGRVDGGSPCGGEGKGRDLSQRFRVEGKGGGWRQGIVQCMVSV